MVPENLNFKNAECLLLRPQRAPGLDLFPSCSLHSITDGPAAAALAAIRTPRPGVSVCGVCGNPFDNVGGKERRNPSNVTDTDGNFFSFFDFVRVY